MLPALADILVDPVARRPLTVVETAHNGHGPCRQLQAEDGTCYSINGGIPSFVATEDAGQQQTGESFGFKWTKTDSYDSPEMVAFSREWLTRKFGFDSPDDMRRYFSDRGRILDAGCGSGYSSSTWLDEDWDALDSSAQWFGADISRAIHTAKDRLGGRRGTNFVQADVMQLPFADGTFDCVFSEGVLHHTPSTETALREVVRVLKPGGEILFYVYRKKSPVREFTDDYVRDRISDLPAEAAWELLKPLTRLGQSLAELDAKVTIPEAIDVLGIPAGEHDVQRLIYWHFAKLFWNDSLTFDENLHINFDWYHPRYAHRQTEEEVRAWCQSLGLTVERFHTEEAGFSVRAIRSGQE